MAAQSGRKGCFICEGKARVSAAEERMLVEEVDLKVSEEQ